MAGQIKVDSINADSNLALKIANTAVAFIDATGLRPTSGNVNLDATATSKLYLPSANTVAIQTAGVTAVTVASSQNVTLAAALAVTGVTTVQAGTAALPAITTTGDTNTGIFFPAADTIAFSEGGAESMRIDSSGNVGINNTSPNTYKDSMGATLVVGTSPNFATIQGRTDGPSGATNAVSYGGSYSTNPINGARMFVCAAGGAGQRGLITFCTKELDDNTTQPVERMRIDSSGSLLINGTTQPVNTYKQVITFSGGSGGVGGGLLFNDVDSGNVYPAVYFRKDGAQRGNINVSTSGTTYNTVSDYRLKEDVVPMVGALAKVSALKPVTYKWKSNGLDGQGFIAHELAEVEAGCVTGEKDAVDADGNPVYQGIDTSFLVATLTAAIQELKAINDTQAETINALTANLTALTARITALESTP